MNVKALVPQILVVYRVVGFLKSAKSSSGSRNSDFRGTFRKKGSLFAYFPLNEPFLRGVGRNSMKHLVDNRPLNLISTLKKPVSKSDQF